MTDSGKGRKGRKRRKGSAERKKGSKQEKRRDVINPVDLIRALDHELRRQILRLLHASKTPLSPVQISKEFGEPLSSVSYHVSVLRGFSAVAVVDEKQVRGAVEHFYASAIEDSEIVQTFLALTEETDVAS